MKKLNVVFVSVILLLPVMTLNLHFGDLYTSQDEKIGKSGLWERITSGQSWINWIYGSDKVSVKLWDSSLKLSSLAGDTQEAIVKVDRASVKTLKTDFPTATVTYLYNDSGYSYLIVKGEMSIFAQKFWQHILNKQTTLADEFYVHEITLDQRMSLVVPLSSYAGEHSVCRTTYDLCRDYGILNFSYSGKGIKIAVLDTGVDRSQYGFYNLTSGFNTTIYNESFVAGEDWVDHNGHGTHCIGIIAGQNTKVAGIQMRGVAPNATIYSIKVLDSHGQGAEDDIISGINEAVRLNVDIISMSLGGQIDYFSALHDSIEYAVGKGIVVVAAAGNSADIVSGQPASWEGVISVEALKENKHIADYTCLGGTVSAEGTNITSLSYSNNNGTSTKSGTSMATPFVAGCIALLLEAQPSLRGHPELVAQYLQSSGNYAPATPKQVTLMGVVPVTSTNYAYATREVNPTDLVKLTSVSDSTKGLIYDLRVQLLRNDGV